ncbi:MAG TPA: glycosyltransferase family 2 protein [Pirellulaceae bacterium]|nr:glycosyltransferase family 2 protein [Pirellulaceae bacterium]
MTTPAISIVVCTFNRAAMLRDALASLYSLATDDSFRYEIVVIDNASTDATPLAIAAAAAESPAPVRGIFEPQKGVVAARNRGIREARGRWIAFFDDDQLADPRWLAELWRGAHDNSCRVVGGAVHLVLPMGCTRRLDPTVRMLLGESILSDQPLPYGGRLTPGCGNLMIERTVFDEVGLFETAIDGRGEDTDLFVRIERAGIAAWYFPQAIIHHLTPPERLEPPYLLNLARKMGRGIGLRQARAMSRGAFTALWLAKAVRAGLLQWPVLALSHLRSDREAALGRACQLAISRGFLSGGCEAGRPPPTAGDNPIRTTLSSPVLSGANSK